MLFSIRKSMRSDVASTSMPGFMTPSTMDSRQILMSRMSVDYPVDINRRTVSKLSREVQQLMRRKVQLMEDLYEYEKKGNVKRKENLTTENKDLMLGEFSYQIPLKGNNDPNNMFFHQK